jgi:hypothetical protein
MAGCRDVARHSSIWPRRSSQIVRPKKVSLPVAGVTFAETSISTICMSWGTTESTTAIAASERSRFDGPSQSRWS